VIISFKSDPICAIPHPAIDDVEQSPDRGERMVRWVALPFLTGIDLNAWVWVIGSERMKADKKHRVPLSDAAPAVPEKMERSTKLFYWADLKGSDYPA
jgi:integrase